MPDTTSPALPGRTKGGFHALSVEAVEKTTKDAVVVSLQPMNGADFSFIPGQYLTFKRDFDGTELRRSYSICTSPSEGILKVGIKRVTDGAFSSWANDALRPGDTLYAMAPMGTFQSILQPELAKNHLGFAGGSGITPVLSILKSVLEGEPLSTFTLVYANRSVNTIMFREEIDDLKNRYLGRLSVVHILENDNLDMEMFSGRVYPQKSAALFKTWIDIASTDAAFICGPEPMMLTIAQALKDHGLSDAQIKFELFASGQPGRVARKAMESEVAANTRMTKLTVQLDGSRQVLEMDQNTSVLDAAVESGLDVPFACKAGVCSTCLCRVLEGEVEMQANHALEDHEVKDGFVLSCQSFPLTDTVVVDYDRGH